LSATTQRAPESLELLEPDPELLALPAPKRTDRRLALVLMTLTALASMLLAGSLRSEASYALDTGWGDASDSLGPIDLGDLSGQAPSDELANRYVRATALLGTSGAIRYGRFAEGDSFRLAPVAGNDRVWIEIRVPEGFEGPRFVPPTTFAGRLTRFEEAGLRHARLPASVRDATGVAVPEGAWLLVDGGSPRASRWALVLLAIFGAFAAWNVISLARMTRAVRDRAPTGER
jgi:hypothetical protein